MFPLQGAWVQSLVIELESHTPCSVAKKKSALLKINKDFPSGPVVKNPPGTAGDTGSIPGPGRFHVPRGT